MTDGQSWFTQYVETGSEAAFREVVARYVDLVYSAAVRLVNGDSHLAEDISQTVFADLARLARTLSPNVMLGGWLHRHTCFVASKTLRGERRRQHRERQAVEMNALEDHTADHLAQVAPVLDEAINQLGAEDRAAVLLRYFEQRDFQSVGEALGSTEEAARKRVDRALDKLHGLLSRHGVAFSVTALGSTLATQAVTAAPAGLAASISTFALAGAAAGTGASLTLLNLMSMTKLKVGIVATLVVGGMAVPWVLQQQTQSELRVAREALQQQRDLNTQLTADHERLSNRVTRVSPAPPANEGPSLELLALRSEVGRLRQYARDVAAGKPTGSSPLSDLTANPEMRQTIRNQQKAAMTSIYSQLTNRLQLPPEQAGKLTDLLADDIMENVDHITALLRDGQTPATMEAVFARQESELLAKVQTLLGPEAANEYRDYTRNLASFLTAEQFKSMLAGDQPAKNDKAKQLYQLMQEETQRTLAAQGLSPDFQTVPSLNFRNFVSETEAEKNLRLLDGIYERVSTQAGGFLSPDEVAKFGQFRTMAVNNNRMALAVNRKLMAPSVK
jgi:RNA polymerase sigma factor (sigma-70 family)